MLIRLIGVLGMKKITIGVLSVGSGIGQSVIDSINRSSLETHTIGLSNTPHSYATTLCDEYVIIPSIKDKEYVPTLQSICKIKSIDILIPGLDLEIEALAHYIDLFKEQHVEIIASHSNFVKLVREKSKYQENFNEYSQFFLKSYLVTEKIDKEEYPLIAKPINGSGSMGIHIILNENDKLDMSDKCFLQTIAFPLKSDPNYIYCQEGISNRIIHQISEISIQVVVSKTGELLGKMATQNVLKNGIPIKAMPYDNKIVWDMIDELVPYFVNLGYRGPLNIQGRLTNNGFKIFEMNARFTGLSGWRSMVGFNEVETLTRNWLNLDNSTKRLDYQYQKYGMRQVENSTYFLNEDAKSILVTGANGYLGNTLVNLLKKDYIVYAYDFNFNNLEPCKNLIFVDAGDTTVDTFPFDRVDTIIHCAFSRPFKSNEAIGESIKFSASLISNAIDYHVPRFINISSKSVYGANRTSTKSETDLVAPDSVYATAKYAVEELLRGQVNQTHRMHYTSLRLGALFGPAKGLVPIDFISKVTSRFLNNDPVTIFSGQNIFNGLDVSDCALGIYKLVQTDSQLWNPVYNFSSNHISTFSEVIQMIHHRLDLSEALIKKGPEDTSVLTQEIDSSKFYKLLNWEPETPLHATVFNQINYIKNR